MRPRLFRADGPEKVPAKWFFRRDSYSNENFQAYAPKFHILESQDRFTLTALCGYSKQFLLTEAWIVDSIKDESRVCRVCLARRKHPTV